MKARNSRWSDEPKLDKSGKPVVITPVESDLKLFQLLLRYRYLPANFILPFTGFYHTYLKGRLDVLSRKPNKFLDRPDKQRSQPNANYRFLIYQLAYRGERALKDAGLWTPEPQLGDKTLFAHSLMVTETIASLELGCRSMIWWPEIAARLDNPQRFIPVEISYRKEALAFDHYNDSNGPFGIRYPDNTARFFSLEAEHTNQVDCKHLRKTSFLKKFLAVKAIMDTGAYKKAWGIPNLVTLVVTASQSRIDTMKDLILRETNGKGLRYIAFYKIPVMENLEPAKPMPEMFTSGWQRAGHPDLYLNEPVERNAGRR
jgi:hypothetical protein